jgi:hypothetical protein
MLSIAVMAALAAVGFARGASATVSVDLVWQDTGNSTLTISANDPGATCNLTGFNGGPVAGRCMDVIVTITGDTLVSIGTSVTFNSASGLDFSQGWQWWGTSWVQGGKTATMVPLGSHSAYEFIPNSVVSDFNGVIAPPAGPPSLPAGTYKVGTIVWNTSGVTSSSVLSAFISALDGFANGALVDITTLVNLGTASLNVTVVPEPGTASLLGLGLVGLIVAGRRNRK